MTPPHPQAQEATATTDKEDFARLCIQVVSQLLTGSGTPKARVASLLQEITEQLEDVPPQVSPPAELIINLPHVASLWHNSPRYLSNGKPRPLPLHNRGACLAEIIASVYPDRKAEDVLPVLLLSGAVRTQGERYVAPERAVLFKNYPLGARIYALATLYGLAVAIQTNLNRPGATLQQAAMLTNFPASELEELLERTRSAAKTTLLPIDDFMTREAIGALPGSSQGIGGIGMYTFFAPTVRRGRRLRKT